MRSANINNLSGTYGDREPWQHPYIWIFIRKYNIKGLFFEGLSGDTNVNDECLSYFRNMGIIVGLNFNPNVYNDSAKAFAERISHTIHDKGQDGKQCRIMTNIEYPYRGWYMRDYFSEIQMLRPGRDKFWSVEGHQGGWMKSTPGLVDTINKTERIRAVLAENYTGTMAPLNTEEVRHDLLAAGIVIEKAKIDYDADKIEAPGNYDGNLFAMERLHL